MSADWDDYYEAKEWNLKLFIQGISTLWQLLGNQRKNMRTVIIWQLVTTSMSIAFAYVLKLLFDNLPVVLEAKKITSTIIWLIVAMSLLKIIKLFLHHFVSEYKFIKLMIILENLWPIMAQSKLMELPLGWHEKENTGKKISKINKGVERLVQITCELRWDFIPHLFYLLVNVIIMLALDWRIGIAFLLPIPIAIAINFKAWKKYAPHWEKWDELKEKSDGFFCQSILNIQAVINFVQEQREEERLTETRNQMKKHDFIASFGVMYWFFTSSAILHLSFVGTIFLSIHLLINGQSTLGTIAFLIVTGNHSLELVWSMLHTYINIMRHLISVNRMKKLLDEPITITNTAQGNIKNGLENKIELRGAYFKYESSSQPILKNVNMVFPKGTTIAIAGPSGSGKSTITKIILRTHVLDKGQLLFDGIPVEDLDLYWYRQGKAVVTQDTDIFDTNIRDNITYGYPDAEPEEINEAVIASHLDKMLADHNRFPDGLDTQVGERGIKLSGGEKQRVGIARAYLALLRGAEVLILDEATSHLDSIAENIIQKMIEKLRKKREVTIIAIAHRLSTIRQADHIYVIDNGRVVEEGNHERLKAKNGLYARLDKLQRDGYLKD